MAFSGGQQEEENKKVAEVLQRAQWLRASILGANDGLLSTTSLMLGVGAAKESRQLMVLSGVAGAIAGALSMAVGEFVSVSTQRDIEKKAALRKRSSFESESQKPSDVNITFTASPMKSTKESTTGLDINNNEINISVMMDSPLHYTPSRRSPTLRVMAEDIRNSRTKGALQEVITKNNGDDDHNKEEEEVLLPNPYKAASASALAFLCGSLVPLVSAIFVARNTMRVVVVAVASSLALAVFGAVGAHLGGSPVKVSAVRVLVGGWIAMGITYGVFKPFEFDNDKNQGVGT